MGDGVGIGVYVAPGGGVLDGLSVAPGGGVGVYVAPGGGVLEGVGVGVLVKVDVGKIVPVGVWLGVGVVVGVVVEVGVDVEVGVPVVVGVGVTVGNKQSHQQWLALIKSIMALYLGLPFWVIYSNIPQLPHFV